MLLYTSCTGNGFAITPQVDFGYAGRPLTDDWAKLERCHMLDGLRAFAKSWPGRIMGALLLIGLAGFGINNVILGFGSNTVARVGSEDITANEFLRAYQSQVNRVAQQIGSVPSPQDAVNFGIPTLTLQQLAQDAALDQLATRFGLGVSEAKLAEMVREDPSFRGTLGTFDPASFEQVLRASGITEAEYFEDQTAAARRQQLVLSLFGEAGLPAAGTELINAYVNDQRTIEYFVLNATSLPSPPEPTEEELAAYLAEHQAEFRTVETRQTQMLVLSPTTLAASKTISDEAIAAEYERTRDSLTQPERRTIEQVVLNADQATAFEAGLTAGTPFEQLVAEAGLTPTSLGTLAQSQVTDPALAEAALGLEQGQFTVIEGVAGRRAVHVSAIEPGGTPSLEEARAEIEERLALAEARNEIADIQDQVEELRAAFRPLTEIAERFGLDLYEAGVTAGGSELEIIPGINPEDRTRLAQAIFAAEQGDLTAAVPMAGNTNVYFELNAIEPARDQTLDEVRDDVAAALMTERTNNALLDAAEEAVAEVQGGTALADVAASYNTFPQLSTPFTRFGSSDGTIDGTIASAAFAGGPDLVDTAVGEDGSVTVFQVTSVIPADATLEQEVVDGLDQEAQIGLYGEFVAGVRDDAGLRINQQALNEALAITGATQ
ncbi:SurA N-terminal domain-containing protein [Devosia albogilva]|uniref:SurA N-terminal domain-containing protein n=1 Tax=Devosia albogilva TaxID=429726 RepID=A0ABW5QPE0_9HYPH